MRPRPVFRDRPIEQSLLGAAEIGLSVLRRYHGRITDVMKKGRVDFVTKADKESEAKVIRYLRSRHPDHSIIAEESWDGSREVPSGYTWVLDPLDGTTNYAHGMEHYALSLGLAYDGKPVAGIVFDPSRDYAYTAFAGRGAFRNRKRIHVSDCARLGDSLIVTGFPYNRRARLLELTTLVGAFLKRTHGIRRLGVASLDFSLVACGRIDGYYEPTLKPWDVAAGALIVEEAGGRVTDYEGRPWHLFSEGFVAAPPLLQRAMVRLIRSTVGEIRKKESSVV